MRNLRYFDGGYVHVSKCIEFYTFNTLFAVWPLYLNKAILNVKHMKDAKLTVALSSTADCHPHRDPPSQQDQPVLPLLELAFGGHHVPSGKVH